MKILRLTFLAFLLAPVCAFAQGTKVIPLGGGFGLDTKVPVSFDAAAFNLKFTQQMNAVRAMQAANQAGVKNLPAAPGETTPAAENEQDYTRCIVCREKILKTDGYQITPKRDWYVKKHSSCACDFYKGWEKSEDLSFVQTAVKRHSCEAEMNKKYETHTCAVCGKPINSACGSISIWEDDRGKHYAHADCFAARRHQAAKEALLKNLDITEEDCVRFDRQKQERANAQKKLVEEMQRSSEQIRLQQAAQAAEPALVTVTPGTRPLKKVRRELNRFNAAHGKALQEAARVQRSGGELSAKQAELMKRFEALRAEYNRASAAENADK